MADFNDGMFPVIPAPSEDNKDNDGAVNPLPKEDQQVGDKVEDGDGTTMPTPPGEVEVNPEPELSEAEKHQLAIMRNAYQKLDGLPLGFGLPKYSESMSDNAVKSYFGIDFKDTMRELRISVDDIEADSEAEMMIENRIVYHALKRFRLTASVFFKFSTAVDGKTVDKTQIPKILKQLIDDYDAEFKTWRGRNIGKLWNRTVNTE